MASKRSREASSPSSSTPVPKRIRQELSFNSSTTPQWNHDVFLSFRGEDTRNNFTDHLYSALVRNGIQTFRDEEELERGENISSELLKAIEHSKIAIIVFSRNYASSGWCLDELVKILECKKAISQMVLPVFYDVDPSDVRKQSGSFTKAFVKHKKRFKEDMEKVERWKSALTEAANLSGWDLQNFANGHESKFIQGIVDKVMMKLNQTYLNVAKYPIGIESHVQHINMLLNYRSDDVRIVGIYGMGGIGKTTISKAVYNLIYRNFEGSSFLANVREVSKQYNSLVHLQEQLLCDVLMKNLTISNVDRGINVIRERFCHKRVLVVLDDVDELNQLNALAGKRDWFGLGSRIIITTRDEHLLNQLEVNEKYKVVEMNHIESLQLFSWHAFKQDHPKKDYEELSNDVVHYAGGLPLALVVLGSFLYDKIVTEWRSELEKLQRIPDDNVMEKLKISFDTLDETQRNIFLYVACFFIGEDKSYAIRILDSCDFFSEIGISVLVHRSLVTIDENNKLWMHDLLRDMGREFVRRESPDEPGARSILWFHEDIHDVLTKHTGTGKVQALILKHPMLNGVPLTIEALAKIENIQVLQVDSAQLTREFLPKMIFPFVGEKHIFRKLRWLCWHGFNLKYIPTNFLMENLVNLDMQHSSIRQVWKGIKFLKKLKTLNLSHSHGLTRTPNFLGLPSLERLVLEGCTSLVEVHQSIGHLDRLVFLNLKDCQNLCHLPSNNCELKSLEDLTLSGCSKLKKLPKDFLGPNLERLMLEGCVSLVEVHQSIGHLDRLVFLNLRDCKNLPDLPSSICELKALEELVLSGCSKVDKLPEDLGNMECLRKLLANETAIKQLPLSIVRLKNLESLSLSGYKGPPNKSVISYFLFMGSRKRSPDSITPQMASFSGLCSLKHLTLSDCDLSEGAIPSDIGSLSTLEMLDLRNSTFCSLPSSISCLSRLQDLILCNCTKLQSLLELPSSIKSLRADDCTSLERLPNLSNIQGLSFIVLQNCNNLIEIQGLEGFESILSIQMERFLQGILDDGGQCCTILPGSKIPEWFSHQSMGSSMSFKLHPRTGYEMKGLIICAVYAADKESIKSKSSYWDLGFGVSIDMQGTYEEGRFTPLYGDQGILFHSISHQDNIWVTYRKLCPLYFFEGGNQVDVSIYTRDKFQVKKCGVHVVYVSSENASTVKFLRNALEF